MWTVYIDRNITFIDFSTTLKWIVFFDEYEYSLIPIIIDYRIALNACNVWKALMEL